MRSAEELSYAPQEKNLCRNTVNGSWLLSKLLYVNELNGRYEVKRCGVLDVEALSLVMER